MKKEDLKTGDLVKTKDFIGIIFKDEKIIVDILIGDYICLSAFNDNLEYKGYFGEKTYSTNELQAINLEINQKKQMSKLAVTTNYFADLEEKLSKKRVEQEEVNKEQDKEEHNE